MIIAESLSSLVDQGDKRMNFKMDELSTPEALWYKSLVSVADTVGTLTILQLNTKAQIPIRPAPRPAKPAEKAKPKAAPPQGTKILAIEEVSDDENADANSDDDGLTPYAKPDSDPDDSDEDPTLITRNKPSAPVYIRTLINYLRSTENYDHQKLGLLHAATLIRRKANFGTELSSHAEEVASLLVGIQDKFEIEDFENLRLQGMIALVVAQPQKMAPWFAKTFFDGDYSISQRASVLTTLGLSARELGGFGSESNSSATAEASFPSKTLPESTHKRFTPLPPSATSTLKPITSLTAHLQTAFLAPLATSLADQSLGPDILKLRTVSSRYKSSTKPVPKRTITNTLATTVSSLFFFPLTGRFFLHLKSHGSTASRNVLFQPYLLAHFLRTLAILLHASGPSTLALPQMTIEFWDLLLSLRTQAAGDVSILEALLFALLTILEINEDKRSLVDENGGRIVETQGWVEGVFQRLGSAEGEEEVKLRMLAAGVLVRIGEVVEKYQALLVGDLIRLEG
jgi:telomere length regulation protein